MSVPSLLPSSLTPSPQQKLDKLAVLMDEAQLFDISSYHEPKEGRAQPARPAAFDIYHAKVKELEEKEEKKEVRVLFFFLFFSFFFALNTQMYSIWHNWFFFFAKF
jgi:hypothetical protein